MAPNVTLGHYKVLGRHSVKTGTDIVAAAFKMAYEDKADIISASFGTYKGWSDEPWGQLIQKLAEAGLPSFIASGNDGSLGLFLASNGIDNSAGIGIGSFNNLYSPSAADWSLLLHPKHHQGIWLAARGYVRLQEWHL